MARPNRDGCRTAGDWRAGSVERTGLPVDPRACGREQAGDPVGPVARVVVQTRSEVDAGVRNVDIAGSDVESARRVYMDGTSPALPERGRTMRGTSPAQPERGRTMRGTSTELLQGDHDDAASLKAQSAARVRVRTALAVESRACVLERNGPKVVRCAREVEQTGSLADTSARVDLRSTSREEATAFNADRSRSVGGTTA